MEYSMRMLRVETDSTGRHMTEGIRRTPIKCTINLKADPPSSCTITLPVDSPEETVTLDRGQLFMLSAPCGVDTMYYIKNIKTDYNSGQMTISGEDVYGLLSNLVVFGKVTPTTINNAYKRSKDSRRCWAHDAIQYALSHCDYTQGDGAGALRFQFDTTSDYADVKQGWSFNGQAVGDIIKNVNEQLDQSQWSMTYNLSTCTVRLKVAKRPTSVECELRAARNMKSLTVTEDTKNMVNRLYVVGKSDANIKSAKTFDRTDSRGHFVHTYQTAYIDDVESIALYGIHAAQESNTSMSEDEDLIDWGMDYIHNRSTPSISVSVNAVELHQLTGAEYDRLAPGKRVRICLPERGFVFQERIVSASFADVVADPTNCTLTIARQIETMKDVIYKTGGGGGGKKNNNENETDKCRLGENVNAAQAGLNAIKSAGKSMLLGQENAHWTQLIINGQHVNVLTH